MANDAQWLTRYRQTITNYLNVFNTLVALREQYDALGYSTTLTPEDFAPPNADIDLEMLTAAVASIEAIGGFMESGFHSTNLYKLVV